MRTFASARASTRLPPARPSAGRFAGRWRFRSARRVRRVDSRGPSVLTYPALRIAAGQLTDGCSTPKCAANISSARPVTSSCTYPSPHTHTHARSISFHVCMAIRVQVQSAHLSEPEHLGLVLRLALHPHLYVQPLPDGDALAFVLGIARLGALPHLHELDLPELGCFLRVARRCCCLRFRLGIGTGTRRGLRWKELRQQRAPRRVLVRTRLCVCNGGGGGGGACVGRGVAVSVCFSIVQPCPRLRRG